MAEEPQGGQEGGPLGGGSPGVPPLSEEEEEEEPLSMHFPLQAGTDSDAGGELPCTGALVEVAQVAQGAGPADGSADGGGAAGGGPADDEHQAARPAAPSAAPSGEAGSTTQELSAALAKRRSKLEGSARTFESCPEASKADASHLCGISFDAPSIQQWLLTVKDEDVEDRRAEFLAEDLHKRGPLPAHLVAQSPGLSKEDLAKLQEMVDGLAKTRADLAAEKSKLGSERHGLEQRENAVKSQERALAIQREVCQSRVTLQDYPRPAFLTQLEGTMNVGVVGNSGVGKSLLINRLRGVLPGAPGWAPVGVRETTTEVSMYAFPNERRVRLWDFPGAGTRLFPLSGYIARFGLRYLDVVIIVTAQRYTETEIALMTELRQFGIPHLMVRTKIDIDLWNNRVDNGVPDEQTLQAIRQDVQRHSQVAQPYLVSLRDTDSYDFPGLLRDLFPSFGQQQAVGGGWGDAWALPVVYSKAVSAMQGQWTDGACTYTVQGDQVHIQHGEVSAVVQLSEDSSGKVWWNSRLWVSEETVQRARVTTELRWTPADLIMVKPLVWRLAS